MNTIRCDCRRWPAIEASARGPAMGRSTGAFALASARRPAR
jgi:hypothetical protein